VADALACAAEAQAELAAAGLTGANGGAHRRGGGTRR
jgi:hypothetical protein